MGPLGEWWRARNNFDDWKDDDQVGTTWTMYGSWVPDCNAGKRLDTLRSLCGGHVSNHLIRVNLMIRVAIKNNTRVVEMDEMDQKVRSVIWKMSCVITRWKRCRAEKGRNFSPTDRGVAEGECAGLDLMFIFIYFILIFDWRLGNGNVTFAFIIVLSKSVDFLLQWIWNYGLGIFLYNKEFL